MSIDEWLPHRMSQYRHPVPQGGSGAAAGPAQPLQGNRKREGAHARRRRAKRATRAIGPSVAVAIGTRLLASALLGLTACTASEPLESAVTVTDSAGIRIVAYGQEALSAAPQWQVADQPHISVGGFDAEGPYALFRVSSISRLSNGDLVVANTGSREIRIFDSTGRHQTTVGGTGEGPAEFVVLTQARAVAGDSIVAFDHRLGRITVFDPELAVARTFLVGSIGYVRHVFGDGSLLAGRPRLGDVEPGVIRPQMTLIHITSSGERADTVGQFRESEYLFQERNRYLLPLFFGKRLVSAVHDSVVWVGRGDPFELGAYGSTGKLQVLVRVERPPEPLPRERIERVIDQHIAASGSDEFREALRMAQRSEHRATIVPPYDSLLTDPEGNLWVRDYYPYASRDSVARWHVLSSEGLPVGRVELPGPFGLMCVGDDWIAGVWRDEQDVEQVRVYRLRRR